MIGYVNGRVVDRTERGSAVVLTVAVESADTSLGFDIRSSVDAAVGEKVELFCHTEVTDIYGFATAKEREAFRALASVSGFGPSKSLAVVSALGFEGVVAAVTTGDADALSRAPGVGKRTAEKLLATIRVPESWAEIQEGAEAGRRRDIVDVLVSLGVDATTANRLAAEAPADLDDDAAVRWAIAQGRAA